MTYEATDEAGNYAEPAIRTVEIQASNTKNSAMRHLSGHFFLGLELQGVVLFLDTQALFVVICVLSFV